MMRFLPAALLLLPALAIAEPAPPAAAPAPRAAPMKLSSAPAVPVPAHDDDESTSAPSYDAPPGSGYTAAEVKVRTRDGQTLVGTLTLPEGARRPLPAVVLITGSSKQDRDGATDGSGPYRPFRQIADTLSRNGIAVLRLDDRGVGRSSGTLDSSTTADRAKDTNAALAFLRTRPEIDHRRLGLIGLSEGALIAPMVAVRDTTLRALVLISSPGERGRDIITKQRRRSIAEEPSIRPSRRDSVLKEAMKSWNARVAKDAWSRFFSDYDPAETAARVRTPVLILQGTADRNIPPDDAHLLESAFRSAGNRDVTLIRFEGRNHTFLYELPRAVAGPPPPPPSTQLGSDVLAAITEWTVGHLGK